VFVIQCTPKTVNGELMFVIIIIIIIIIKLFNKSCHTQLYKTNKFKVTGVARWCSGWPPMREL